MPVNLARHWRIVCNCECGSWMYCSLVTRRSYFFLRREKIIIYTLYSAWTPIGRPSQSPIAGIGRHAARSELRLGPVAGDWEAGTISVSVVTVVRLDPNPYYDSVEGSLDEEIRGCQSRIH